MNNKGQLECESHYYSFYNVTNQNNPFPEENKIILDENKNINNNQLLNNKKIYNEKIKFYSANTGNSTAQDEKENQNIKRNSRSLCLRKNNRGGGAESVSEILGVKLLRKEFDNEFLNDCEIEISHLEFDETNKENEKDLNLKMDILKDYNLILKEREKRKNFIFEKNLLDLRRQNRIESKLSKEEYDLLLFMRPFHRFYENSEFFEQFESVIVEQQLKLMLKTLNKLENEKNSKGGKISTFEDIEKYFDPEKNVNKGRKHNTHEHNKEKEKDKEKDIIYEENLLANRIERLYEYNKISKEKKIDEIFDKDEFDLVKEMPLARSTFYEIKLKIKDIVTNFEKNQDENLKEKFEKLIEKYGLERQTHLDIFEFYCKKYNDLISINENEIKKEKDNKKVNKDIKTSHINENEEIKSESNKSNNKHKHKKPREKKKTKNKIIEIKDDNESKNKKGNNKDKENNKEKGRKKDKESNKDEESNIEKESNNETENNKDKESIKDKERKKEKESPKEKKDKENNKHKDKEKENNLEESVKSQNNDNKMDIEIESGKNKTKENKEKENCKNKENKKNDKKIIENKDKENEKMEIENDRKNKKEVIENNKINDINNEKDKEIEEEENKDIKIEKTNIKYYKE